MSAMLLGLSVACGTSAIAICGYMLLKRSPGLGGSLMRRLHASGRRSLGLSEFKTMHPVAFASGHALTVAATGAIAGLVSGTTIVGCVTAVFFYVLPSRWFAWQRKRRRRRIEAELPDALLCIAGALRAGSALPVAIHVLVRDQRGPLGQELGLVLEEQRLGVSFDDAIQNMSQRLDIPDFVLVVVALRVSKEVGGNLSQPLQMLAETLRRKAILEGRIHALTAQGRIQGIVMTLFPIFLLGVLYPMQPAMRLLFTSTVGWVVLAVVGTMLALGYATIRKIVAIDI